MTYVVVQYMNVGGSDLYIVVPEFPFQRFRCMNGHPPAQFACVTTFTSHVHFNGGRLTVPNINAYNFVVNKQIFFYYRSTACQRLYPCA